MPDMEITVVPPGTGSPPVSGYVRTAVGMLEQKKGVRFRLAPVGTIVEAASPEELLEIAAKMHEAVWSWRRWLSQQSG